VDVIRLGAMIGWQVGGLMRFENWGIIEWFDVGAQRWWRGIDKVNWKAIKQKLKKHECKCKQEFKTQWIDIMC